MPSHLTRHVFRRILASEPIVHRGCLRRQYHHGALQRGNSKCARHRPERQSTIHNAQRRTLFNLGMFRKKREPAEANMHPGLDKMLELEKLQRLRARLPPPEEVARALGSFVRAREIKKSGIEDNQAQLVLQSLQYCLRCETERKENGADESPLLTSNLLVDAARTSRSSRTSIAPAHIQLYRFLFETVKARPGFDRRPFETAFYAYVSALSLGGSPHEALDVTNESIALLRSTAIEEQTPLNDDGHDEAEDPNLDGEASPLDNVVERAVIPSALTAVLRGFAKLGLEENVFTVLEMIRSHGAPSLRVASIMQQYHLAQNDFESALDWWREWLRRVSAVESAGGNQWSPTLEQQAREMAYRSRQMLDWCLEHDKIDLGHQIVQELTLSNPRKPIWDVIFVWAAATRKGVEEIDRMIDVMLQSNEAIDDRSQWRLPNIETINALVEFAISRGDPYMAERFIALGADRDIQPNAKTYVLQMNYRLQVSDVDGALTSYKNLQEMDLSSNEDVPTVNHLIVALCSTQRHDFDTIMNVAADLSDRRVRFNADTVAALTLLHLRRDEKFDVIDLLNTHAYHFSSADREHIRNDIIAFALDPATPVALSWDAYTVLREQFDETPRTQRTELMSAFIRRERPDMGVHVFQNMRMHSRADTMPTVDTYVAAFMALAKARELDSLEVVHNQLKLDYNIDHTTYLLNAMILAYTACGSPRKALDFWDQIAVSREGPSYNSVHVALRACEKAPFGDLKAQEIWSILRKRGVELDQPLWASYIAALAGNGDNEMAIRELEVAAERDEVEIDGFVLGSLFMGAINVEKQAEIEGWAKERYGEVWEGLVRGGIESDISGMRWFGIDRSVAP